MQLERESDRHSSPLPHSPSALRAVTTLDLHSSDQPADHHVAAASLAGAGLRATVFVPSAMLGMPKYHSGLRAFANHGHEPQSHSHHHDWTEIEALRSGGRQRLGFLAESRSRHEDFFGESPTAFRSPCWSPIGAGARSELARLGYRVDSSATPQRVPLFTSAPFRGSWMRSPRAPYLLSAGLLEIPTSTLIFPLGTPTVLTFRGLTSLMLAALMFEAWAFPDRLLVLQSHAEDWNPATTRSAFRGRLTVSDFWPNPRGGFRFKEFIRTQDPRRTTELYWGLMRQLSRVQHLTLLEARAAWDARREERTPAARPAPRRTVTANAAPVSYERTQESQA
jgi:peptidoglycan/xylan/chitin deacetylase (PgdA/CDA1 family)